MQHNLPSLWAGNHPRNFWRFQPDFSAETWAEAIGQALPVLELPETTEIETALAWTLGEEQFGPNRYYLGFTRRLYYHLKPFLPRAFTRLARRAYNHGQNGNFRLGWPIEDRYARFQWEILRHLLLRAETQEPCFKSFWPEQKRFAFVITHDIETAEGQCRAPILASLEEAAGFRSSFNFVPKKYPLDYGLIAELRQRGFEIGIHGLNHDGKLFNSQTIFTRRAEHINQSLAGLGATGFRSPLTLRNPAWMQALNIEYDSSFFDSDPFEPMPGGVMSIWPFFIGRFVELPYTLPQDFTLYNLLGETTPRIWLKKIEFIERYHGLALVNVHPDYSGEGKLLQIYTTFLKEMMTMNTFWQALPCKVAAWWKHRALENSGDFVPAKIFVSTLTTSHF